MTTTAFAVSASGGPIGGAEYRPGVCNIGAAEVRRRRQAGHVGLVATIALFALLAAVDAPAVARLLVTIPAMIAASGYIQARLKFCAGFGTQGVFNFGSLGESQAVVDDEARARDRARARQIGAASLAIGLAVGIIAFLLPL